MAIKLRKGNLVKANNIIGGESTIVKVVDSKYSKDAIEVEIMEGVWKGLVTIVSNENLIIPNLPSYQIVEVKRNKSNIIKEVKEVIKSLNGAELRITNYHQDEWDSYCNDIEVQIWENQEYVQTIVYKSYEIESFNPNDWWDMVDYMDIKCFKEKEEIFNYIESEFKNYDDVVVSMGKGYWV